MPISPIVLQRRHAELGRIRLGAKRGGNGAPMKLESFRFTSHSERYIRDLAELYGGEARPWDNNGVPSWEVYTTATSVPVIAVKGGLSQWMETWSGGGCTHRCDGERGADGELCNPKDRAHLAAKPTTRLSLMLPELEAIGVWRLESHGWNAAAEIPAVAELAQYVGDLVPANLHLVERRSVKDGKTSRFVVPVLDLQIGTARLREIANAKSGMAAIEAPGGAAVGEAPAALSGPRPDYLAIAKANRDLDEIRDLWRQAKAAGHLTDELSKSLQDLASEIEQSYAAARAPQPSQVDEDGAVDAVIVEDQPAPTAPVGADDADAVWQQILAEGGHQGMSLADVNDDFAAVMGGLMADDASASELSAYLVQLQARRNEQVPA